MAEDLATIIARIEEVLGVPFKGRNHLEEALTHRSYVNEVNTPGLKDNERYEFLGDAVLQLAVSDFLMRNHPSDREGLLSKYRSAIVNERALAQVARGMELGRFIRLGKGEELTQGRKKDSILADVFEAVVAAVYVSEGYPAAARFVEHHLHQALKTVIDRSERQDFKTQLQELTQRVHRTTPLYRLVLEDGPDHDKTFESEVVIDGRVYGRGRAKSKKDSEQLGAEEALEALEQELNSSDSKEAG
jgi:ribonuclease-3